MMQALVISSENQIEIIEKDIPQPSKGEVLIKLKAAALNRRDQWIREGKYPNIQVGSTLGSDGSGVIYQCGEGVDEAWLDREVILMPHRNWGDNVSVQSGDFQILGMPLDGTFAEYISVPFSTVVEKPGHLTFEEAASLPLAGETAFRACFYHGKISEGQNVLISGFGGGVAQFAFHFAIAAGANVWVTSGNKEKRDSALKAGARSAFDYRDGNWIKEAKRDSNGFDIVIDSAGGDQVNDFIKVMKPAGKIIFYGATNGLPANIDLYRMFWNQIALQGTTMGSDSEFFDMVNYIAKHEIRPVIDSIRPFHDILSAFDAIKEPDSFGKLVVKF